MTTQFPVSAQRTKSLRQLPPVLQHVLNAVNENDTDGFLGFFDEDGFVDDWGRQFVGPEAIRGWSDNEFIGKQVSLRVTGVDQRGQVIAIFAEVGGKGFNGPSRFTFTLNGNQIHELRITAT
jgi:hypothetical protein